MLLTEKFIVKSTYIKDKKRSQVNNVTFYLKELEKRKQANPSLAEENYEDQSKNKWKSDKQWRASLKKIRKINKTSAKLTSGIRADFVTDTTEIQRIIGDYYRHLYANK